MSAIVRFLNHKETGMDQDQEHLNLLSLFHYIVGGLGFLFSLFPIIHVIIGYVAIFSPSSFGSKGENAPPEFFGWIFLIFGLVFIFTGFICSACIVLSGIYIKHRKKYWFSFVVACIQCVFFPFGTALGIFSIVVLSRNSVKNLYGINNGIQAS